MKVKARIKDCGYSYLMLGCDGYEVFNALGLTKDDDLSVEIKRWRQSRSLGQNAIWHKLLSMIADKTGNDLETVKEYIKESFGIKIEFNGMLVNKPSHLYDKSEWSQIMEPTIALAIEYGVDTSWV